MAVFQFGTEMLLGAQTQSFNPNWQWNTNLAPKQQVVSAVCT